MEDSAGIPGIQILKMEVSGYLPSMVLPTFGLIHRMQQGNRTLVATLMIGVASVIIIFIVVLSEETSRRNGFRYLEPTVLFKAISTSSYLRSAHGCLIASTLPLVLDTILDIRLSIHRRKALWTSSILIAVMFIVCNVVPSTIFLTVVLSQDTTPFLVVLYVAMNQSVTVVILTSTISLLSTLNVVPGGVLIIVEAIICTSFILTLENFIFPGKKSLTTVANILTFSTFFLFLIFCTVWAKKLVKRAVQAKLARRPFLLPKVEIMALIYR
jgi:hypothetical protein